MRREGKGVGETGVSPWREAASPSSVENRGVLKINPARLNLTSFLRGYGRADLLFRCSRAVELKFAKST